MPLLQGVYVADVGRLMAVLEPLSPVSVPLGPRDAVMHLAEYRCGVLGYCLLSAPGMPCAAAGGRILHALNPGLGGPHTLALLPPAPNPDCFRHALRQAASNWLAASGGSSYKQVSAAAAAVSSGGKFTRECAFSAELTFRRNGTQQGGSGGGVGLVGRQLGPPGMQVRRHAEVQT